MSVACAVDEALRRADNSVSDETRERLTRMLRRHVIGHEYEYDDDEDGCSGGGNVEVFRIK